MSDPVWPIELVDGYETIESLKRDLQMTYAQAAAQFQRAEEAEAKLATARQNFDDLVETSARRLSEEMGKGLAERDAAHKIEMSLRWKLNNLAATIISIIDSPELLEILADIEHERWSGWEEYRDTKIGGRHAASGEWFGDRWRRQRETPYAYLTEAEKESDRVEARKGLAAIRQFLLAATPDNPLTNTTESLSSTQEEATDGDHSPTQDPEDPEGTVRAIGKNS